MQGFYVDTNVFLRFLLNDNAEQYKRAEALLRKARAKKVTLIVLQIIIFEISFILKSYYHLTKEEITGKLESLIAMPYLFIEERAVFRHTLVLYKSSSLSFVDCFLLCKAKREGKELFTFDKNLQQRFIE